MNKKYKNCFLLMMIICLVSTIFFISYSSVVIAAGTYYVDNSAVGSNNGTSWTDAWKSFDDINWSVVSAGDTIYISGGNTSKTYNSNLVIGKSGSSGKPITITKGTTAGHNGKVILNGGGTISAMITISNRSYVVISGITTQDTANSGHGVYINSSSYITIDNCTMLQSKRAGIFIQESNNCILSKNYIETPVNLAAQTDGIYSQRNSNCTYDGNTIYIRNTDADGHDDIIQSYQDSSLTICNNYGE